MKEFLDRFPAKIDEFEGLLTKNDIYRRRTEGVGYITKEHAYAWGLVGPIARAGGSDYDVRKYFPYTGYENYDFKVPTATEGDVYARYRVRVAEMREPQDRAAGLDASAPPASSPATTRASSRRRRTRSSEMEALIQHFLIYSGFTRAGGRRIRAGWKAARSTAAIVSDGTNRPWRVKMRAPSFLAIRRCRRWSGRHRGRRGRHRLHRRRHGRLRPVSFHPQMEQRRPVPPVERKLADEGQPFAYTPENQAKFDENVTHYPPEQRKSAILYALYLAQGQIGYLTGNAMRFVAQQIGCTTADVEDVVSYYTMFYTKPVGKRVLNVCRTLSCALLGAERVTEALSAKLGIKPRDADGEFTLIEVECRRRTCARGDGQRRLAHGAPEQAAVHRRSRTWPPRSPAVTEGGEGGAVFSSLSRGANRGVPSARAFQRAAQALRCSPTTYRR